MKSAVIVHVGVEENGAVLAPDILLISDEEVGDHTQIDDLEPKLLSFISLHMLKGSSPKWIASSLAKEMREGDWDLALENELRTNP